MENAAPLTLLLGICGIALLAVGVPLGIYFSLRQKRGPSTGEVITRAGKGARRPWSEEDADLDKLSDEVARFKTVQGENPPPGEGQKSNPPEDGVS